MRLNNERENQKNGDGGNAECRNASSEPGVVAHGERRRRERLRCAVGYIQKKASRSERQCKGREGTATIIQEGLAREQKESRY
jgi:hypothetical protein